MRVRLPGPRVAHDLDVLRLRAFWNAKQRLLVWKSHLLGSLDAQTIGLECPVELRWGKHDRTFQTTSILQLFESSDVGAYTERNSVMRRTSKPWASEIP